ncbi:hypothetical protein MMC30_001486, partial [Trapelia coarctata]|nr:hypothetical protein [Trapelia coarctata]
RRRSRSPYNGPGRARSPIPQKRSREVTAPAAYRQRSPPPAKQGRYAEPARDGYDRRYSPARDTAPRFRENNYRPRERTRTPPPRASAHVSRGVSPNSSRRSSPPQHLDRMVIDSRDTRSPAYGSARRDYPADKRSPPPCVRDPSPPRRTRTPPMTRSPPHEPAPYRDRSPPPRERDRGQVPNTATPNTWSNTQMGGQPSSSYRNGDARTPANGSASRYDDYPRGPRDSREPREPASSGPPSAPVSMSAHNRATTNTILSAPTRPRGGPSFGRDNPRDASYNSAPPHRGGRGYNGPTPRYPPASPSHIPTGPRGSGGYTHTGPSDGPGPRPPFRPNNSSSTTYPRTQRFNTHLASVPAIVDGGKKMPSGLDAASEKRLQQLEEDKRKLMEVIEEKQRIKRQGLREWDRAERESAREGLRSELAEGCLGKLSGEGVGGGAY